MRKIDADNLESIKFHSLPYTHITPTDADAESYKRGWNDAIDSIIENEPTIEPERKTGRWIGIDDYPYESWECDQCGCIYEEMPSWTPNYCPNCGAKMGVDDE